MFNLIQDYTNSNNQQMKPEFIVQEAGTSQNEPFVTEETKQLIVVSSESEEESEEESEDEDERR